MVSVWLLTTASSTELQGFEIGSMKNGDRGALLMMRSVFYDFCLEEDAFWLCSASLESDTQRDLYQVCKQSFQIW